MPCTLNVSGLVMSCQESRVNRVYVWGKSRVSQTDWHRSIGSSKAARPHNDHTSARPAAASCKVRMSRPPLMSGKLISGRCGAAGSWNAGRSTCCGSCTQEDNSVGQLHPRMPCKIGLACSSEAISHAWHLNGKPVMPLHVTKDVC